MTVDPSTLELRSTGSPPPSGGGTPEFQTLQGQYGGTAVATTSALDDDPVFDFPKAWETAYVLLSRGTPVTTQAPGAAGRRVGGLVEEQVGATVTGGGGERITLADLMREYYHLDSPGLASYQQALWLGGFYTGSATPLFGVADKRGFAAWEDAVRQAARSGKPFQEVLDERVAANAKQQEEPPSVIRLTNPTDIARVAKAAGREVLGEAPTPEQVQSIVRRFHAAERDAQQSAATASTAGGTYNDSPRLEAFALAELERTHPVETEAYRGADQVLRDFGDIISGPFGAG